MDMKMRPVIEIGIYSFIGLSLFILSYLFPFFLFILPVPFIVFHVRRNQIYSFMALFIMAGILYFLSGPLSAAVVLIYTGFLSYVIGYLIRQNFKVSRIFAWSSISVAAFILLSVFFLQYFNDIDIVNILKAGFANYTEAQIKVLQQAGFGGEEIQEVASVLNKGVQMAFVLLPALLIILSTFLSYLNYYLSAKVLRQMGIGIIQIPNINQFRLPKHMVAGTLVVALGIYFMGQAGFAFTNELSLNAILIFSFLFTINGIAAVDSILKRRASVFIRVLLPVVFVLFLGLTSFYALIGVFDLAFDVRDRFRRYL